MRSGEDFLNSLKKKTPLKITYERPKKNQYFYIKKMDRYLYIKSRIQENKKYFLEILNKEFKPVTFQSESSYFTYGVIFITPEKDIYIYNNDNESNDTPIKLNLNYCKRFSLFHGQLVVLKGKNLGDNEFLVSEIHCLPILDHGDSNKDLKCKIKVIQNINEKIDYDADVVIFIGCKVPEDIISSKSRLTHFIHVPTMEDFECVEVYPMNSRTIDGQIHISLNNPCQFKLEDKLFCVNTLQVLDLLCDKEICKNEGSSKNDICGDLLFSKDKLERLCYHLIFQRSFLPMLNVKNVCYNVENLNMLCAPDYYFIRSQKFEPFFRDIGPTKILNIGENYNWDITLDSKETKMKLI
ncbi:hypothetical protein NCER_100595 [Vairimorpha ceranae BRL01]|uniref:DNA polymerase alpha subunit B n=2 Tax=Vairimorpha ceranae TaxID=40302 RepID=C4V7Z7_VAIC1|nr:dna polymerase alpha subunit b [Vairimorpha ceranae]EEQ82664.1 hypothetical protein NCER_100595 [Vairimorpha ceranae BRL01]KAF5141158.1 hypothetical protein G9O61_00g004740 [Vairimorpha ceranae]KKO75948.1 dna polymerase alpha subunit b [Vairimorpha ceranae]